MSEPMPEEQVVAALEAAVAARDQAIQVEQDRVQELTRRVGDLERDHERSEDVKRARVNMVERDRQLVSLVEQIVCTCGEGQCPRCAALALLQS